MCAIWFYIAMSTAGRIGRQHSYSLPLIRAGRNFTSTAPSIQRLLARQSLQSNRWPQGRQHFMLLQFVSNLLVICFYRAFIFFTFCCPAGPVWADQPSWAGRGPGLDGQAYQSSWAGGAGLSWPGWAAAWGHSSHAGREISCWEFKGTEFLLGLYLS